jgi:hypothetical protein
VSTVLAVCLLSAPISRAAPEYTFYEIVIPGGSVWGAMGINNLGLVSGSALIGGLDCGFVYSVPAGTSAIYAAGTWNSPGGINDAGQIVGAVSENSGATWTAFTRAADGTTTILDHPFTPGASWDLIGVNESGDTVGSIWDTSRSAWAGVIQTGGVYRTVSLGEPEEHLTGINDAGGYVGYSRDPVNPYDGHAWIFRPDGALEADLLWDPAHPLDNEMRAYDINNSDVVVGTVFRVHDAINQGWIREADGDIFAISYPGSANTWVTGINDAGEIVGRYEDSAHSWHTFVGTPVPEPGTAALLLAGLGVMRIFRLRRTGRCGDDARP